MLFRSAGEWNALWVLKEVSEIFFRRRANLCGRESERKVGCPESDDDASRFSFTQRALPLYPASIEQRVLTLGVPSNPPSFRRDCTTQPAPARGANLPPPFALPFLSSTTYGTSRSTTPTSSCGDSSRRSHLPCVERPFARFDWSELSRFRRGGRWLR